MSSTLELLNAALQALEPEHLDIQDDSALHAGHAGARRRRTLHANHCQRPLSDWAACIATG